MKINKADIILAVLIAIVGLAASIYLTLYTPELEDGVVVVHADNRVYGQYPLDEDKVITVKQDSHINKITIKDDAVQMTFSNCKSQDCVKQGKIKDGSKSIICLPHKVVIEIESKDNQFDSVSR